MRLHALDALRGLAVVGMAVSHAVWFGHGTDLMGEWGVLEAAGFVFARVALHGKVTALFALVFGYAMALQWRARLRRGQVVIGWFRLRALLLVALGVGHSLVWSGDILLRYGLASLVVVEVAGRWPRWGVRIGAGLALLAAFGAGAGWSGTWSAFAPLGAGPLVAFIVNAIQAGMSLVSAPTLYLLAAMLAGVAFARAELHADGQLRIVVLLVTVPVTLWSVAAGTVAYLEAEPARAWTAYLVGAVPGGVAYLTIGLHTLANAPAWLTGYGRAALSNYLAQTLVFLLAFRLAGLEGQVSPIAGYAFAAALVAGQVLVARAWRGPLPAEAWLRRRLGRFDDEQYAELVAFARGS